LKLLRQEKVPVADVVFYRDDERQVECVHFEDANFGLRLTNSEGRVTKLMLSKVAVEQIVRGFGKILTAKPKAIKEQKFIMDTVRVEE
jgi:hypothetical protein